jgi:hypothetical protein
MPPGDVCGAPGSSRPAQGRCVFIGEHEVLKLLHCSTASGSVSTGLTDTVPFGIICTENDHIYENWNNLFFRYDLRRIKEALAAWNKSRKS